MMFIKDFGAIADGKTNSTDAFSHAIRAAKELDEPVNPHNTLIDAGGVEGLYIYDNKIIIDEVSSQIEPGSIIQ